MTPSTITSAAHIDAITRAITALVDEYEVLDGRVTPPSVGRRTAAMEQVCGVTFDVVTADLDPYAMDDPNDQLAEETLAWSLFITDVMTTALLDSREWAAALSQRFEDYRDRLIANLLEIWLAGLEELKRDPDEADPGAGDDQGPTDTGNDAGDADDAGEWGTRAA